MDIRIYIMTHKKFPVPRVEGYFPMQVGKAGKEDLGYLGDDTGDNISEKNHSFCELTGLYWAWKNITCDIIGLCHYRRYFLQPGAPQDARILEKVMMPLDYVEACLQQYDLILPISGMTREGSVLEHYRKNHCIADWEACGKVIEEKYPQYYQAFLWNQDTNVMSLGNMVIGKKGILDEYCGWLFDILFELEKRIDLNGRDEYQARVFGFLSERLFRVWMMMQRIKIREEMTAMIE